MANTDVRKTDNGYLIGEAVTDKIGHYGVTPVVQPASANQAVATDAASVIVLANALRTALIALGLIKGSA
jgi:hypothetical protein